MTEIFIIGAIFFLGSFVQGLTGFGAGLIAIPLLTLVVDIKVAVPLYMLTSLVMTNYMAFRLRRYFDRGKILPLCIGAVPGIIAGATILKTVPSDIIRIYLGAMLIGYALYNFLCKPTPLQLHHGWGYLAGFLSGAIGTACSAGGPPAIIYTTLNSWNKNEMKATLTGFFFFNSYLTIAAHAITGMTTFTVVKYFLFTAPFVLAGTVVGSCCYGFFRTSWYLRIVLFFLLIMGVMLISS